MSARRLALRYGILLCASLLSLSAAFAASALAAGPSVDSQYVTGVHSDAATLNAQVNPSGADTTYRFEYGTSASYGTSVPIPDADIGSGSEDVTVQQRIEGLQPGTIYHYRVRAGNEGGISEGVDRTFTTYVAQAPVLDTCPNAGIRATQFSSYLPDCRAYELVSPMDTEKAGANIAADASRTQSAVDGDAVKYYSKTAFGDALGTEVPGAEYIARRETDGWVSHSINPVQASIPFGLYASQLYQAASPDLSKGVFYALTPVVPGYPNVQHVPNLYLRNDLLTPGAGEYDLLSDAVAPVPPRSSFAGDGVNEISFAGASADWSHILFESNHDLTPEAEGLSTETAKAYEWDEGVVRLAGILPDGTPAQASIPGDGVKGLGAGENGRSSPGWAKNAISADGSRIVFTGAPLALLRGPGSNIEPAAGILYMRIDHSETVQLNTSERTDCNIERKAQEPSYICKGTAEPDPQGAQPAEFTAASRDDSKVFFVAEEALTDDAEVGVKNLYMYELNRPARHHLTLISVDAEPADGVVEETFTKTIVVGLSEDGSYVYFTSANDLLPGLPPLANDGSGDARRLYLWHDGVVHYVVNSQENTADYGSGFAWGTRDWGAGNTFRVSPDGKTIAFVSSDIATAQRVGYDNSDRGGHCAGTNSFVSVGVFLPHCFAVYVYKADENELLCASCNTTGAAPDSDASFVDSQDSFVKWLTSYLNHPLSDDGRYVFFDTREALVPSDTNGEADVYEYDAVTKTQHLISAGTCGCDSIFADASADGTNVFFTTRQQLVHKDVGTSSDMYDARVEGGIPSQNLAPAAPCTGEDCQGPIATAPGFSLPASLTFAGEGNAPAQAPAANVKKSKQPKVNHKKKPKGKKYRKKRKKLVKRVSRRVGR